MERLNRCIFEAEHGGQDSSQHGINLENGVLENKSENTAVL